MRKFYKPGLRRASCCCRKSICWCCISCNCNSIGMAIIEFIFWATNSFLSVYHSVARCHQNIKNSIKSLSVRSSPRRSLLTTEDALWNCTDDSVATIHACIRWFLLSLVDAFSPLQKRRAHAGLIGRCNSNLATSSCEIYRNTHDAIAD